MRGLDRRRTATLTADIPGDLGEQFGALSRMADEVRQEVRDTDLGRERLLELGRLAEETTESMRDIVWLLRAGNAGLYHVVEKMRERTLEVCGRGAGHFRVSGSFRTKPLPLMFVRRVYLIFREALGNAARHGRASTIQVFVTSHEGEFTLRVRDDGKGFNPQRKTAGSGVRGMRRRATEVDGRLEIHSSEGRGTVVTLKVKLP